MGNGLSGTWVLGPNGQPTAVSITITPQNMQSLNPDARAAVLAQLQKFHSRQVQKNGQNGSLQQGGEEGGCVGGCIVA